MGVVMYKQGDVKLKSGVLKVETTDLISVVVISFNSEKFIEDTLKSIAQQTYPLIELIITDDASKDETLTVAEEWLKSNSQRFVNSIILSSNENQGIPNNLNRGIRNANGKYVKHIAADDMLAPTCLEMSYNFCEKNNYSIFFSNVLWFYDSWETGEKRILKWEKDFFEKSINEKKNQLCCQNILYSPTAFYKKELIEEMGYFDEGYKYMEDYPMWVKILESGYDIAGDNIISVFYRRHQEALSDFECSRQIVNKQFYKDEKRFFYNKRLPVLLENGNRKNILYTKINYFFYDLIIFSGNRKNVFSKVLIKIRDAILNHIK